MKKIFVFAMLILLSCVLSANTRKQITFVDDQKQPRTDLTSVTVWDLSTATASTIYTDLAGSIVITNPMTLTSSRSTIHAASGTIFFCSSADTHDIEVVVGGVTVKFYAIGGVETTLTIPRTVSTGLVLGAVPTYYIWVSPSGDDSTSGNGSFTTPYKTITKALATATTTRNTILVMPGEYAEAALTWPEVNGVVLAAMIPGTVTVNLTTAATTPVITIYPASASSTFGATISGIDIESNFNSGVALRIDNTYITKKLNVYLNDVGLSTKNVTDSSLVVVNGAGAGQAIRVYATGNYSTWEGLVDFTAADTGDRLRIYNTRIIGSVTMNEAVVSELSLINCATPAPTVHSNTLITTLGCWTETDADPDGYTIIADADSD